MIRSGNREARWLEEAVKVVSNSSYRLVFEAETGDPHKTYIALDDFSITPVTVSHF